MRERRGIIALVFALVIVVFFAGARITEAAEEEPDEIAEAMKTEILSEFDFSELDSSLREMFPGEKVTFSDIVSSLISGGIDDAGDMTAQFLKDRIAYDFLYNRKTIVYIILAALVAAVFSNFADAFQNRQISDISFYVIYMLLITLCLTAFQTAVSGLEEKMGLLTEFIRALAPAYFMAMAFASGSAAALVFYNLILFLIYIVELIIIHILLPAVNIYVMICVLGSLIEEDFLSELAGLIRKAVTWALHGLLACVAGIHPYPDRRGRALGGRSHGRDGGDPYRDSDPYKERDRDGRRGGRSGYLRHTAFSDGHNGADVQTGRRPCPAGVGQTDHLLYPGRQRGV